MNAGKKLSEILSMLSAALTRRGRLMVMLAFIYALFLLAPLDMSATDIAVGMSKGKSIEETLVEMSTASRFYGVGDLILHNSFALLIIFLNGLTIVRPILNLASEAILLRLSFSHISMVAGWGRAMIALLPHAPLEILSLIIATTASLMIPLAIFKIVMGEVAEARKALIDSLVLILTALALVSASSTIEYFISWRAI